MNVHEELNRMFEKASPLDKTGKLKQDDYSMWVKLEGLLQWAGTHSCGEGKRVLEHAQAVAKAYRQQAEFEEATIRG